MRHLEINDWLVLNNIIYKIYTTEDEFKMRYDFLEQLHMLVDFDSADFFVADPDQPQELIKPAMYRCGENHEQLYPLLDYSQEILFLGNSMVYRETDIVTDVRRQQKEYYRKLYRPNGWHYSMQMIIAYDKKFFGVVTFYRAMGKDNFQYDDIFILDMLKDHLAYRLQNDRKRAEHREKKLTIKEAVEKYQLTKREETILGFLMDGADNIQICDELVISLNTLKKHILNIYRKLGIRNRVQLFKMVREYSE